MEKLKWGSDIASRAQRLRVGLASSGDWNRRRAGAIRCELSKSTGREPVAASIPLEVSGAVTALWTESGGTSVVAVVHNSETGRYEAFRLTLTCGR